MAVAGLLPVVAALLGTSGALTVKIALLPDDPYTGEVPSDVKVVLVNTADGTVVGESPHAHVRWKDLRPGKYEARIESSCFPTSKAQVSVVAGRDNSIAIPIAAPTPERRFVVHPTVASTLPPTRSRALSVGTEVRIARLFTDRAGICSLAVGRPAKERSTPGQWLVLAAKDLGDHPTDPTSDTGLALVQAALGKDDPLSMAGTVGKVAVFALGTDGGAPQRTGTLSPIEVFRDLTPGNYSAQLTTQCADPIERQFTIKPGGATEVTFEPKGPAPTRRFVRRDFRARGWPKVTSEVIAPEGTEVAIDRLWGDRSGECTNAITRVVDGHGLLATGQFLVVPIEELSESPAQGLSLERFDANEKEARAAAVGEVRSGSCSDSSRQRRQAGLKLAVQGLEVAARGRQPLYILQDQQIFVVGDAGKSLTFRSAGTGQLHVIAIGDAAVSVELRSRAGHRHQYDAFGEDIRGGLRGRDIHGVGMKSVSRAIVTKVGDEITTTVKGYGCVGVMLFSSSTDQ